MKRDALILILLGVLAFGLAAAVQSRLEGAAGRREADSVLKAVLGEGRRMFANHFAVKADVYLHSGFYPSMFDQAAVAEKDQHGDEAGHVHTAGCDHENDADHDADHGKAAAPGGHECDTSFMGEPKDWVEKLGRHFIVAEHSHLEGGKEREILPWLKLSAELDPQRIETYLVGAYWLVRLKNPNEAEAFLRQGLRANPQSYEILFELGKIYDTSFKQPDRARGIWKLGLRRWDESEAGKKEPDKLGRVHMLDCLAQLEEGKGNYTQAIRYFEEAKNYSPHPEALDERIRELRLKMTLSPGSPGSGAPLTS
jgi:tetratricopeptide (TPR) repeat protein